jgi:hypothetical protein
MLDNRADFSLIPSAWKLLFDLLPGFATRRVFSRPIFFSFFFTCAVAADMPSVPSRSARKR